MIPLSASTYLPAHIHMAWCGTDVVILDLLEDRYALLVDVGDVVRPGPMPGTLLVDTEVRGELAGMGLVTNDRPDRPRLKMPDLRGELAGGPGGHGLNATRALLNSIISTIIFKDRPLGDLVTAAAGRRRQSVRRTEHLAAFVGMFQSVQPLVPFEGDCLQRAWMLHHHLHACGFAPRWVFGVRTWPFLAHCWVQIDDHVVGDRFEHVQGFTPILAV